MRPSEVVARKAEPDWHAGRLERAAEFQRAARLPLDLPGAPPLEVPALLQLRPAALAHEDAAEGQPLPSAIQSRLNDLAEMPDSDLVAAPEHPPGTAAQMLAELDIVSEAVQAALRDS